MSQFQCPHCKMFKVDVQKTRSIGHTVGGWMNVDLPNFWRTALTIYLLPFILFYYFLMIVYYICIISIPFGMMMLRFSNGKFIEYAKKYDLKCELCGYEWNWRIDENQKQQSQVYKQGSGTGNIIFLVVMAIIMTIVYIMLGFVAAQ